MVMHLACVNMGMSMPEALAAATINAAYALGKSHTHGSLEVGKQGDAIIINASRCRSSQASGNHSNYQLSYLLPCRHVLDPFLLVVSKYQALCRLHTTRLPLPLPLSN